MRGIRLTCLVVLALAMAAGHGHAQDALDEPVTVTVTPFPAPLAPLSEVANTDVTVSVACHAAVDPLADTRPVTVDVAGPSWATVTVSPDTVFVDATCTPGTRVDASVLLTASVDMAAPALEPAPVTVTARVPDTTTGDAEAVDDILVAAAYRAILVVDVVEPIRDVRPGTEETLEITVTNRANGFTDTSVLVSDVPDAWRVDLPEPFVLAPEHAGTGQETARLRVPVTVPAMDAARHDVLEFLVRGEGAYDDATHTDEVHVTFLVKSSSGSGLAGTSGDAGAPAPGVLALVGVASGAALALGRAERR